MIIGYKLNDSKYGKYSTGSIKACDVSWISKFPDEKEVLLQRGASMFVDINKIYQIENCQYIAVGQGSPDNISFQSVFAKP